MSKVSHILTLLVTTVVFFVAVWGCKIKTHPDVGGRLMVRLSGLSLNEGGLVILATGACNNCWGILMAAKPSEISQTPPHPSPSVNCLCSAFPFIRALLLCYPRFCLFLLSQLTSGESTAPNRSTKAWILHSRPNEASSCREIPLKMDSFQSNGWGWGGIVANRMFWHEQQKPWLRGVLWERLYTCWHDTGGNIQCRSFLLSDLLCWSQHVYLIG